MSAPPTKKRILNCRAKRRYNDEVSARAAAMYALDQCDAHGRELQALYVYTCPECGGYHLTRKAQGYLRRVERNTPYIEARA